MGALRREAVERSPEIRGDTLSRNVADTSVTGSKRLQKIHPLSMHCLFLQKIPYVDYRKKHRENVRLAKSIKQRFFRYKKRGDCRIPWA